MPQRRLLFLLSAGDRFALFLFTADAQRGR